MESTHIESLYPVNSYFSEIEALLKYIKEGSSVELIGAPGSGRSRTERPNRKKSREKGK